MGCLVSRALWTMLVAFASRWRRGVTTVGVAFDQQRGGEPAVTDGASGGGECGDVASRPDRVVGRSGVSGSSDRRGFTSEERVRDVIHNFTTDGFDSLTPKYAGGRPHKFDPPTRAEIARIALTQPKTLGKPWTRWSLPKLCDNLVETRVVEDISVESVRRILDAEGVSFQRVKTWKESNDDFYEENNELIWALIHDPPPGGSSRSTSSGPSPVNPSRDGVEHGRGIPPATRQLSQVPRCRLLAGVLRPGHRPDLRPVLASQTNHRHPQTAQSDPCPVPRRAVDHHQGQLDAHTSKRVIAWAIANNVAVAYTPPPKAGEL